MRSAPPGATRPLSRRPAPATRRRVRPAPRLAAAAPPRHRRPGARPLEARRRRGRRHRAAFRDGAVFTVNTTVGFLSTTPRKLFLPPPGAISRSRGSSPGGARRRHRRDARGRSRANACAALLPGRSRASSGTGSTGREAVKGGRYVVRVVARNTLGTIELARTCASSASSARRSRSGPAAPE